MGKVGLNSLIDFAEELEKIAVQMRSGAFDPVEGAVLVTSDKSTGIMTICNWGETDGLIARAHNVHAEVFYWRL